MSQRAEENTGLRRRLVEMEEELGASLMEYGKVLERRRQEMMREIVP